jgi:hypothetical protein
MTDIPPFIQDHIRKQKQVVAQRRLNQRRMQQMVNYNIPEHIPKNRRDVFGSMSNVHYETVSLNGITYTLWYENEAQRQQLMNEARRKQFGVMSETAVDDFKENTFGMI